MSSNRNNPSLDPADNDTLAGAFQFAFKKLMQNGVNGMLPARIIAYDTTTNRAQIQLMIMIQTTDGSLVSRQQIASVPVFRYGGGGFVLKFPLKTGDLGWLSANDRDITLFTQSYKEAPPNTARMFSFSDGVFFPDAMVGITLDEDDSNNVVLQNEDGSIKITIASDTITLKAPDIILDGDVTATGLISAEGGISATGGATPIEVTGNLRVEGDITASGDITPHVP